MTTDDITSPGIEHSLWLMPTGGTEQMLADTIYDLSHRYSSPLFPPHITLLGGLLGSDEELSRRARLVAQQIEPFTVELTTISYLSLFFRALFIQVRPTEPLMQANQIARQLFGKQDDEPYMPHLSLLYGNFPSRAKESIIERLGSRLSCSFEVPRIYLYSTHGDTSTWEELGVFPLYHPGE